MHRRSTGFTGMGKVSLTIDNGPHGQFTPEVLQVLARRSVPATFFVLGEQMAKTGGAALVERMLGEGHVVGNHTWTHKVEFGCEPGGTAIEDEVERTAELLARHVSRPRLFRPVGGGGRLDTNLFSRELIDYLCAHGYTCALWNQVPRDWEDVSGWVDRALSALASYSWNVVVVHDVIRGNAEQIAAFIDGARARGHEFVPDIAPECLPIVDGRVTRDLTGLTGC